MDDSRNNRLPDVRDGLNPKERAILHCLKELQKELGNRNVQTIMLYGRVAELINIGEDEFQAILFRMTRKNEFLRSKDFNDKKTRLR